MTDNSTCFAGSFALMFSRNSSAKSLMFDKPVQSLNKAYGVALFLVERLVEDSEAYHQRAARHQDAVAFLGLPKQGLAASGWTRSEPRLLRQANQLEL